MDKNIPMFKQEKLTSWKQEPNLEDLKEDLRICNSAHQTLIKNLDKWDKDFKNPVPEQKGKMPRSSIRPKLIRQQAEWRIPALTEPFLTTDDLFKVNPRTFEDKAKAIQNELVLNYQFNSHINKIGFIDGLVRKLVPEGTAIIRTGWDYQEVMEEVEKPVWAYQPADMQSMQSLQQALELQQSHPDSYVNEVPEEIQESIRASQEFGQWVMAVPKGMQTVKEKRIVRNRPTLELCNLRNVYIDPTCEGDFSKAQFVIYSFETTLSELKRDSRYKNVEKLELKTIDPYTDTDHSYTEERTQENFKDTPRKKVIVYEYWGYKDISGDGVVSPIVASWVNDVCIRMEENPFPDGEPPFVVIPYIPIAGSVYGEPDGELLADNQEILGAVTRGIVDLLGKSANSQIGMSKMLLDPVNKTKFLNGDNYEYNPGGNPNTDIVFHKYPEIPSSALNMLSLMRTDAEALSGIKGFSQGITGAGLGDTAAGVRSAMDAASKREMSILRRISNGLIEVAKKILSMNFEFLSEEEVIRVTNEQFVKVRRDDLKGEFDLRVSISTAEVDEVKAKELAFMLQTIGNNMGMDITKLMLSEIFRLRRMPDLAETIKTFTPQPSEQEQQMQQLQMQLLQAQVELTKAQAAEAAAKGQVNQAKVGVEQARAESLQGDADLKTQDFVRTQTGDKHLEELDKRSMDIEGQLKQQEFKNMGVIQQQQNQMEMSKQDKLMQHALDMFSPSTRQA